MRKAPLVPLGEPEDVAGQASSLPRRLLAGLRVTTWSSMEVCSQRPPIEDDWPSTFLHHLASATCSVYGPGRHSTAACLAPRRALRPVLKGLGRGNYESPPWERMPDTAMCPACFRANEAKYRWVDPRELPLPHNPYQLEHWDPCVLVEKRGCGTLLKRWLRRTEPNKLWFARVAEEERHRLDSGEVTRLAREMMEGVEEIN